MTLPSLGISKDEFGLLADSFNDMAKNLYRSRNRILRFFNDVFMTMVRVLDARDRYTQGHSSVVGIHAAKIALRMGYTKEKVKQLAVENARTSFI